MGCPILKVSCGQWVLSGALLYLNMMQVASE